MGVRRAIVGKESFLIIKTPLPLLDAKQLSNVGDATCMVCENRHTFEERSFRFEEALLRPHAFQFARVLLAHLNRTPRIRVTIATAFPDLFFDDMPVSDFAHDRALSLK
jgi:hypothetical protein